MLACVLMSMVQQASEQDLMRFLAKQNTETLREILQCFVICQCYDNIKEKVNDIANKSNEQNKHRPHILYNTHNFKENEKQILSMFENDFQMSLSRTKPLINDVMGLIFSYFPYWEVFKYLALIDKQWNNMSKKYKLIAYSHNNIWLSRNDFRMMSEIAYVDYRREEDGKFVRAKYITNTSHSSSRILLQHSSKIESYKSGMFDPSKYHNILAYNQSIVNQKFVKNENLLKIKDELLKGKIMDAKLKGCYLIYNNIKYFQIRITEWVCGIIYDLSYIHQIAGNNNNSITGSITNAIANATATVTATTTIINKNNNNKNNNMEEQPYTSQIPLLIDITEWCKSKCKNDPPSTIYHNLYSYDCRNKQFIKIEKNVLDYDLVLFQYWVHGDFVDEIAPFQSHSSIEEQRKLRKMMPILLDIANNTTRNVKNENQVISNSISQVSSIQ